MRKLVLLLLVAACAAALVFYLNTTQHHQIKPIALSGQTMGTSYHIKVVPNSLSDLNITTLQKAIDSRLTEIDQRMSTYKQSSELSTFNQFPAQQWMTISPELFNVIKTGLDLSKTTHGSFDMTVGNLVNLWGFGPTINASLIPSTEKIDKLKKYIGYKKLKLQMEPPALSKENDKIYLDLSAIAKGYAVDATAEVLTKNGINNFLVEIGGEIIANGHKSNGSPWVIGIEKPEILTRSIDKKLYLTNVAMATSGDYRNYFEKDGVRYSHTIDPQTGYPIKHKLASVTVIASNCMIADGMATAFMVMGPEKALEFAEKNNMAIYLLIKAGDDFTEVSSSAFNRFLVHTKSDRKN